MIQCVYVSIHVYIFIFSIHTLTVCLTEQFLPWFFQLKNPLMRGTVWKQNVRLCSLLNTVSQWAPRAIHLPVTDVFPSFLALPPAAFHSIPWPSRKADTFICLESTRYVSWRRAVVAPPSLFAGVTVSPQIVSTEALRTLSLRLCLLRTKQSVWHTTGTKQYVFIMNKKTSSFRMHLLLLWENDLINVTVWRLVSEYTGGIISGERTAIQGRNNWQLMA